MKALVATISAGLTLFVVCSTAFALYKISETGNWPKDWPAKLEPLRKQAQTITGPTWEYRHFAIRFADRDEFEAAWPHLLKVKSEGAPIFLVHKASFLCKGGTGVVMHCPPEGWKHPEAPNKGYPEESQARWSDTNYIELVVDGKIVDLNRIHLPTGTPIVDERFTICAESTENRAGR